MGLDFKRMMSSSREAAAGALQAPGVAGGQENSSVLDMMQGIGGSTEREPGTIGPIVQLMGNGAGTGSRGGSTRPPPPPPRRTGQRAGASPSLPSGGSMFA